MRSHIDAVKDGSDPWVFHNATSEAVESIHTEGLTRGSFTIKPIDFGRPVWLAVRYSDLPQPVQEHDYGGVLAFEPTWEPTTDPATWNRISPDKIFIASKRGRIIRKL